MIEWDDEQLEEVGLDKKKVESVVRRLNKLGREMESMGLAIYGASGTGCLVHDSRPTHMDGTACESDYGSVIANLDGIGRWDGGDW